MVGALQEPWQPAQMESAHVSDGGSVVWVRLPSFGGGDQTGVVVQLIVTVPKPGRLKANSIAECDFWSPTDRSLLARPPSRLHCSQGAPTIAKPEMVAQTLPLFQDFIESPSHVSG